MSIFSKIMVVFAVLAAGFFSAMVSVFNSVQPSYREAYDRTREHADVHNALALGGRIDALGIQSHRNFQIADREGSIRQIKAQIEAQKIANTIDKEKLTLALSQLEKFTTALGKLEKQVAALQEQLTVSQTEVRRLASEQVAISLRLTSAERVAELNDLEATKTDAQNTVLKLLNRSLDDKVRQLELQRP